MGILPSKESHEYPGAFHFAQSGCHAMAILPLTEHFFPSVDSLAFKQLYACRDMQSAKYNFSLVSPQIIAKYRERALEKLRAAAANDDTEPAPPKDRWRPRPCLANKDAQNAGHCNRTSGEGDLKGTTVNAEMDEEEAKKWVEVDSINSENFNHFFRDDTRCISPDESEWPLPNDDEELCGELQHPNPSAHWRTHDAARQYLQLENQELQLHHTSCAGSTVVSTCNNNISSHKTRGPRGSGSPITASPTSVLNCSPQNSHLRSVSAELGMSPEEAAEYANHEREYIDKFFSRSPEALYNALVVEPNRGFLVDTNKEMCDIYAAETRWKEARKIVCAYRRQCKEDAAAAAECKKSNDLAADSDDNKKNKAEDAGKQSAQQQPRRRITKEEADEAAKVPPPPLFLRPAPQVIVVRIHREEEEAARAKYFAEQQRKQQQQQQRGGGGQNADAETGSAGSRSASPHATSACSPVSENVNPLPSFNTLKSPTSCASTHLHAQTTRYHRFEDDDRYKDGRIHLVEEDGVLYMFAYNTAYVDPRKKMKEGKQRHEEQRQLSMEPPEPRRTSSSSAADDDNRDEPEDASAAGMLAHESRQTSSFYHTVDAFGSEDAEVTSIEGAKKTATAVDTVAVTTGSEGNNNTRNSSNKAKRNKDGGVGEHEDDEEEESADTAFSAKHGGLERQQDTAVFVDDPAQHRPVNAPQSATDDEEDQDDDYESADERNSGGNSHGHEGRFASTSLGSESTPATPPVERPRDVQQLQLITAAPFILPICPVRVVGCNGYTESSCRGTPWLRGYDDDPEEDAYVESLPVRPPVMSGGGFIDANIGDKILSRAFLLGLQVFRNVCLDAGLPETLTRPFWTLGLLSNIPLLQISREMRFRMRAAAAEVEFGFQGLRDMIKGTENDLQSYIYGFSDILPYLERTSQAQLQQVAEEEAAHAAAPGAGQDGKHKYSTSDVKMPQVAHPLLLPENNEPYVLPTRASQPIVQRNLRFPRRPIEFYTQLTIRGNQCLSRVRTKSQLSFFHLIAEATAPVSTSLFMKPLELNMYDYGGAVRLHLLKNKFTGKVEAQILPPPKDVAQLIRDHQRRVELRRLAATEAEQQQNNINGKENSSVSAATTPNHTNAAGADAAPNMNAKNEAFVDGKSAVRKSAKEREVTALSPYLVFTVVQPSASAKGPSLEHYRRIMMGPDGRGINNGGEDGDDLASTVDLTDAELPSMCDPAALTATDDKNVTRCTCYSADSEHGAAQPVFAPHQYLYDVGAFVDGDMVVYNVHAGRWEHFEYFHRQRLERRRAQRKRQKQLKLQQQQQQQDSQEGETPTAIVVLQKGASGENHAVLEELSDDDEEDIHQEDILLCWIKRRLQCATMRNRQDPGWLRDNEGHIVQEGRYYIWGFEHDDQRYFYGLIPKFAKEKKAKRHNNEKTMNAHASMTSMNSHHHRHGGGGGSSTNTPSAMSISPNISNISAHELRRLTTSRHRDNSAGGGGSSSGRQRKSNSPGARSARSSQSQQTRTPQSHHNRHGSSVSGGDFGESGNGGHVQVDAQLPVSLPDSQTWRSQQQQLGTPVNSNTSSASRRATKSHDRGLASVKGNVNSRLSSAAAATEPVDSNNNNSNNSNSNLSISSAVRSDRAGQKPPTKVSTFFTATAAQSAASTAKDTEGSSASFLSLKRAGGGNPPHPPRVVSAPLQSTSLKGSTGSATPSTAKATKVFPPAASGGMPHSPSSFNEGGARVCGVRQQQPQQQSTKEPASYPAERQQQQADYTPVVGNATPGNSNNRRCSATHSGNIQRGEQLSNKNNNNGWYLAHGASNDRSPLLPPPSTGPTEGTTYDNTRCYVNGTLSEQQQQTPHRHPPTVYMNTSTVNIHRSTQTQLQQQVPQPRRAQQQQQVQQQSYGHQPQMNTMSTPSPCGGNTSPPPPRQHQRQQQQYMQPPIINDAFPSPPPPPPMQMNGCRHSNNNLSMMSGGSAVAGNGMYADPSSNPSPNPSLHSSFYPSVFLMPQHQQQQHRKTGNFYAGPPPQSMSGLSNTSNSPYGRETSSGSIANSNFLTQNYPRLHTLQLQQQSLRELAVPGAESALQPSMTRHSNQQQLQQQKLPYHENSNMGHYSNNIHGETAAGMTPPASPLQQQQQPSMNISMRGAVASMPPPRVTRNVNVVPGSSLPQQQQQLGIPGGNPNSSAYPRRQMMGDPNMSSPPPSTNPAMKQSVVNAGGNRGGNDMGMYSNNSNVIGPAGASPTYSNFTHNNNVGGWGIHGMPLPHNNSSSKVSTPNPAGAGRAAGTPAGNRGPYLMPNSANPHPLQVTMSVGPSSGSGNSNSNVVPPMGNRNNAYPTWGSAANVVSNRAAPIQQQGPYAEQACDVGYGHNCYNQSATSVNNNRPLSSSYPQQQLQMNGAPSLASSYTPTPVSPPQQQQQCTVQRGSLPHHPSTHNNPYSKLVTASPPLSYTSRSASSAHELSQQLQPQHYLSPNNANNPYGYAGSTPPHPLQDAPPMQQQQPQQRASPATASTRSGSSVMNMQQHHLVTPTGNTSSFARHAPGSGAGPSDNYPLSSSNPAVVPRSLQQQQQQPSASPSPSPSSSHFPSGGAQQQQRSGDNYSESGNCDPMNSQGQLPRFAHNPYAMQ